MNEINKRFGPAFAARWTATVYFCVRVCVGELNDIESDDYQVYTKYCYQDIYHVRAMWVDAYEFIKYMHLQCVCERERVNAQCDL